jgi:hypothetical protein
MTLSTAPFESRMRISPPRKQAGAFTISNIVDHAKFYSRWHDAVIRVYDEAGNLIETHEHVGDFKMWWVFTSIASDFLLKTGDREESGQAMPIIRVTREQIQAANKAREARLKKDDDFRRFEEQRQRLEEAAKAREVALEKQRKADTARNEEQPSWAALMRRSPWRPDPPSI